MRRCHSFKSKNLLNLSLPFIFRHSLSILGWPGGTIMGTILNSYQYSSSLLSRGGHNRGFTELLHWKMYFWPNRTCKGQNKSIFVRRGEGPISPLNTRGRSCDHVVGENIANHGLLYSVKTLHNFFYWYIWCIKCTCSSQLRKEENNLWSHLNFQEKWKKCLLP